jgi:hypothetical protein
MLSLIRKNHFGAHSVNTCIFRGFYSFCTIFIPCHPSFVPFSRTLSNVLCSLKLKYVFVLCPTSYGTVSRLWSLSNVLCILSDVSVLCLASSVLSASRLTSLFLVTYPLSTVSLDLSPVSHPRSPVIRLCSLSYVSVPCLPSSVPCPTALFLFSYPLSPVSLDLSPASHRLSPVIRLCSLSKILWDCSTSVVLV